ncbi:hypothetical protein [Oceaniglobus ichthyenteri]|uniref:hypothetical protein n=1 Tax=Oceaniglobus ichthyenteri TaxID=2136177 RepID=UPI000D385CA3|nr:hypothetical protein [Oceaniglobus ichthyenteri]
MRHGIFLPLIAVIVVVAAISGTIFGTVINGMVLSGAMVSAHVCALRAGQWRVVVFALIFTAMPVALALSIADMAQITVKTGAVLAFEQGRVTQSGLLQLLLLNVALSTLALIVDTLALRFLPR